MFSLKSAFSSICDVIMHRLAPIPMQNLSTGKDALEWLSQEVGLDQESLKKALLRPGQNDWTVDPSDLALELLQKAQGVIQLERRITAMSKTTGFTALSVPWALAFIVSPGVACLATAFFSGPMTIAALQVIHGMEDNKKAALDKYTAQTSQLKNLFIERARDFDRKHGDYPVSIDVEISHSLKAPVRAINDLYVKP